MTSLEHFKKIADSFLEADDDLKEWLSLPALRRAWHLFFGILFVRLLSIIMEPTIAGCFNSVERGVFICRLVDTLLAISIEAIILLLAFEYYKYILNKKSNVCLSIIITIYCISTIVCGSIYRDIYLLDTGQFIYHDPPFVPLPTLDPSHGLD